MKRPNRKVLRGVFNALMVGVVGFGASEALASPAGRASADSCLKEEAVACNVGCREALGPEYRGWCTKDWGTVSCECFQLTVP